MNKRLKSLATASAIWIVLSCAGPLPESVSQLDERQSFGPTAQASADVAQETPSSSEMESSIPEPSVSSSTELTPVIPASVVLTNLPAPITNTSSLNISVGGERVTQYAYEILIGDVACGDFIGAEYFDVSQRITDLLQLSGVFTICAVGKSVTGIRTEAVTRLVFTRDQNAPTINIQTTGSISPKNGSADALTISFTVLDSSALNSVGVSVQKDAASNQCLNNAMTAFDAVCPNVIDRTSASPLSVSVPFSALGTAGNFEITVDATDAIGNQATLAGSFTWSPLAKFYAGVQNSSGNAFVQPFTLDVNTNAVVLGTVISLNPHIGTGNLRGLALGTEGKILVTSASNRTTVVINSDDTVSAGPTLATTGTPANLANYHGICQLPDNTYIAGSYTAGSGNAVYQFNSSGTYLRTAYTTTVHTLTACVAHSASEVYLIDYHADNDNDGDIVKITKDANNVWSVASRFDLSASIGGGSSLYALVMHTDGTIYAPPQNDSSTKNRKMIRCPNRDLSQCVAYGTNIMNGSQAFVQSIAQIPGSNDLLVMGEKKIWRYRVSDGTPTALSFVTTTITSLNQIRHLVTRP